MNRLDDNVALVVDGDSDIGRAAALAFAAAGAQVGIGSRHAGTGRDVATLINERGQPAHNVLLDPLDPESCDHAIAQMVERYGRLDVLCNTSMQAPERRVPLHELSEAEWDVTFAAGVTAVALPTRFALRVMKRQQSGVIIVIGSSAALVGVPGLAAFSGMTGVLTNWMRSIALDGTSYGIRTNLLSLGGDWAPVPPNLPPPPGADDIASLLVFLASDASRSINGQVIGADGGVTAWRVG
jgi:NAD(P)-dependent dehydrogenase (short-subunit alcohol dehydrogenase family)